jgi:hypothetical protein
MHTWRTKDNENIIWEQSCGIPVDYEEYNLLQPDFYKIEDQCEFLETINFENYFNEDLYKIYGGDTHYEWRPQLIKNHLCALESQKRVYNMVINSGNDYDFILFIRPDVFIMNSFDINWLTVDFDIAILNYDHNEGLNDKFAIIPFNTASPYATRIDQIAEFRKNHGRIVSEKYVMFIICNHYPKVLLIEFNMDLIRPNGK